MGVLAIPLPLPYTPSRTGTGHFLHQLLKCE